jgi:hypothetical protein
VTILKLGGISGLKCRFPTPVVAMQHMFAQFLGISLSYWATSVKPGKVGAYRMDAAILGFPTLAVVARLRQTGNLQAS